ncbi:MAG: hypothetical protein R2856_27545 [Caldilineaceae bacterium]
MNPLEPLTLLMTAVRQLIVQEPPLADEGRYLLEEWTYRLSAGSVRGAQNILVEQSVKFAYSDYYGSDVTDADS